MSTGGDGGSATTRFRAPRLVAIPGSLRRDSANGKLLRAAVEMARERGAEVTLLESREELELPLYDSDLEAEAGSPEPVKAIKAAMQAADGLLFACPEYNGSVTPMLKNLIDWCSRPHEEGEAMYSAFRGKAAAVVSASPGALGGLRGLGHARDILGNVGCIVVAEQAAVGNSFKAFDAGTGALVNEGQAAMVDKAVRQLFSVSAGIANEAAACEVVREQRASCAEYGEIVL